MVAKESEIILKSEWDIFINELQQSLKIVDDKLKKVKKYLDEAELGGYKDQIEPQHLVIATIRSKMQQDIEVKFPRVTFEDKEPLHVRDSAVDFYKAQLSKEKECNDNFKELAEMSEEELSSEGKRKLRAVANCPTESLIGGEMHPDAAKFVAMAAPKTPPGLPRGGGALFGLVAVGALLLMMKKKT